MNKNKNTHRYKLDNRNSLDLNFQFDVAYIFTCWGEMFGITFEISLELVT